MSDSLRPYELHHGRPPAHHQIPEFTQTHVHWVGDAIQPSHPLSSPSPPPPIPPSIRVFSHESTLRKRWPKYWSFSLSISPNKEHPGLISFRMDWLDLLAVQGLSRVFSNTSLKASILQHSAFFIVQLSHLYMTTGKTISLTRQTFDDKVIYLLFHRLSRSVITLLPRSKCLLISWLQSPLQWFWSQKKIKPATVSTVSPSICHEVMGPDGEGNGTPLQYSCLEKPMDGGAWWAAVHGVARSWTRLSNFTLTFHFHALEEEMETHSSVLAWRIPCTEEPCGLPYLG